MIKQAGTVGYVSISGRKIAAILLILICSFAMAWATRSGKGNKSNTSVKPAQPLVAHTNQAPMGGRPVSPATHNHSKAAGKAHTHHTGRARSAISRRTPYNPRGRGTQREPDRALTKEQDRALTREPDRALTQSRTQHQLRHRRKAQARHRIQHLV
jgi:hypothetical protein